MCSGSLIRDDCHQISHVSLLLLSPGRRWCGLGKEAVDAVQRHWVSGASAVRLPFPGSWSLPPAARKAGFGTGSIVPVGFPGGSDAITLKGEVSKQQYATEATQDFLSHLGFSEMTNANSFHSFMCF